MSYLYWNSVNQQNTPTSGRTESQLDENVEQFDARKYHHRRSLEEACMWTQTLQNLEVLNADQVVTRCRSAAVESPSSPGTMIVVDHLRMWVLDEGMTPCLNSDQVVSSEVQTLS